MGCDRISDLPDTLLTHILSYLTTKDSFKTSILSTRWKSVWLMVPVLDLVLSYCPPGLVDNFMEFDKQLLMQKFKIKRVGWYNFPYTTVGWICTAIDHGVQHIDVETDVSLDFKEFMPQKLYGSKTLVSLKLVSIKLKNPKFVVSLPCLKTMHLENILYDDDPLLVEKLMSGCHVLEDLSLINRLRGAYDGSMTFLHVRSKTLKSFRVIYGPSTYMGYTDYGIEIDAPKLEYMNFGDYRSDKILVKNLSSLFVIEFDTEFRVDLSRAYLNFTESDTIRDFLAGISSVSHMVISKPTQKVLHRYSKWRSIPKFKNLYHLVAAFSNSTLKLLQTFLKSCPNLKTLILDFSTWSEKDQVWHAYVPQCPLQPSLECVEIKELVFVQETVKKLVKYFLENSVLLKKLILSFKDFIRPDLDSEIFKEIRTYAKGSCSCQIIISYNGKC